MRKKVAALLAVTTGVVGFAIGQRSQTQPQQRAHSLNAALFSFDTVMKKYCNGYADQEVLPDHVHTEIIGVCP